MPHWKEFFDNTYTGAYEYKPNENRVVKIVNVVSQSVINPKTKKEEHRPIIYFDGNEKPMVANKTNCKSLQSMFGANVEDWVGKYVTLYRIERALRPTKENREGEPGLRIKPADGPISDKPIICADCNEPIKAVGSFSAQRIAQRSMETFGVNLCMTCAQKRQEAQSKEAQQTDVE